MIVSRESWTRLSSRHTSSQSQTDKLMFKLTFFFYSFIVALVVFCIYLLCCFGQNWSNAGSSMCESEHRAADWPLKVSEGEQLTEHTHRHTHRNITVTGSLNAANTAQKTFAVFSWDILLTGPAPVGRYSQFVQKSRNKTLSLCETGLATGLAQIVRRSCHSCPNRPNAWPMDDRLRLDLLWLQELPGNTEDLMKKSQ